MNATVSQISIIRNMINSLIEANIWQMDSENQIEFLKAIVIASCDMGEAMPSCFIDWIYWKFGRKIAEGIVAARIRHTKYSAIFS